MTTVFTSIEEAVDNNKLCVRKDKAVHADIGDVMYTLCSDICYILMYYYIRCCRTMW